MVLPHPYEEFSVVTPLQCSQSMRVSINVSIFLNAPVKEECRKQVCELCGGVVWFSVIINIFTTSEEGMSHTSTTDS